MRKSCGLTPVNHFQAHTEGLILQNMYKDVIGGMPSQLFWHGSKRKCFNSVG